MTATKRLHGETLASIDAYRLGHGRLGRWEQRRTLEALGVHPTAMTARPSSDRWGRCWQAEWAGCTRAVRAFTRGGAIRKAAAAIKAGPGSRPGRRFGRLLLTTTTQPAGAPLVDIGYATDHDGRFYEARIVRLGTSRAKALVIGWRPGGAS